MRRSATRPLSLLLVAAAFGVVTTSSAQAFTPPIGSDKGSVVATKYYDMSSPYLLSAGRP